MKCLITGGHGFVGPHLRKLLESQGHKVIAPLLDQMDVRDFEQIRHWVSTFQPDKIFHLAAVSWPGESLRNPRRTFDVNTGGTINVLEAVRTTGSHAKILITGTSEEYGYERPDGVDTRDVIHEGSVCLPTTPYGASKLAATTAGQAYARRYGMNVVCTRAWNHTGWGRQAVNAESSFARRIVAVERGQAQYVTHGDLSAYRNFTSVRDVVKAYVWVIDEEPGIYNVCSGPMHNVSMQTIMDRLVGMSEAEIELKEDPNLVHRDPLVWPVPSAEKIRTATGWIPEVTLHSMLSDVLNYWRNQQ
jgi:GDP-4-dehydro-6-deoxy-D-mannose reductase